MTPLSRREFTALGLATSASFWSGIRCEAAPPNPENVHRHLLDLAARYERERREWYGNVKSKEVLENLQATLTKRFRELIGAPHPSTELEFQGERPFLPPPMQRLDRIAGDGYVIDKIAYESFPGYFVPALLYVPEKIADTYAFKSQPTCPAVLSPCGHSPVGKAADTYQVLHVNLARQGYVVLTYDPVGQGERSQFWDEKNRKSRFNLTCGEHAVLGNPLYLLGSSLAWYRIWDGIRGIDLLSRMPGVNEERIGCAGNSGGGTLTAYISALDPRVHAAAICCYITTLPRRMGNRIQADPDADPEQDIADFVSRGIDHAGLLALRAPRPTFLGAAIRDFFPIEGARESFAEAKALFEAAGAGDRIEKVEADERHGLSLPLREGIYRFFHRWLKDGADAPEIKEQKVTPRPANELLVCRDGQAAVALGSRPLLPLALEEFQAKKRSPRPSLRELLRLDPEHAHSKVAEIVEPPLQGTTVVLINGNDGPDWKGEKSFLKVLEGSGHGLLIVDPRGVGELRPEMTVSGHDYADPLVGVEENIAYNAFLVGKSLLGMRATDVLEVVRTLKAKNSDRRVVLVGRQDAALVACFAAAVEKSINAVATDGLWLSFLPLFRAEGIPINAASILPGLLRDFGDMPDVLKEIAPRRVLAMRPKERPENLPAGVRLVSDPLVENPALLLEWLKP